jgi:metallo-beta-lactamase class B
MVITTAALVASFLTAPATAQSATWNEPAEPFRIAEGLYYVGTKGLGAYLFTSPEGHILLDGALPASVPEIESNIDELGFKVKDIKILLNSHAHFDHSGGLAQLKKDTGAKLVAHEGDKSALEGGFYLGSEMEKSLGAPPVKVDRAIRDGDTVELGLWKLTAHHTPGHSRGCTSWGFTATWLEKTHDALVFCSASVAANRITPPLQYPGIVEDYRKTFAKAEAMNVDMFLAPHAEFIDLWTKREAIRYDQPSPFVVPGEFAAFIASQKAMFEKLLAERTAAAQAKP